MRVRCRNQTGVLYRLRESILEIGLESYRVGAELMHIVVIGRKSIPSVYSPGDPYDFTPVPGWPGRRGKFPPTPPRPIICESPMPLAQMAWRVSWRGPR